MLVLIALMNLLGAASPCKILKLYTIHCWHLPFRRICWPFNLDQLIGSAHLTENLNVAFELFQMRTGEGLNLPIHRNGLTPQGTRTAVGIEIWQSIDLCHSEKGRKLTKNAEKFRVMFMKACDEDGAARREIRNFLYKYTWDLSFQQWRKYGNLVLTNISWLLVPSNCLYRNPGHQ